MVARTGGSSKPLQIKQAAGQSPELYIYDDIGPDWAGMVSGETVSRALESIGNVSEIVVRINSGGGDVFEGFAIYNALVRHPAKIRVMVDALAASAASLVAMAGNSIQIADNGMLMVHNAWTLVGGNKDILNKTAGVLAQVDGNLANTYYARTNIPRAKIVSMMDAETWLTAAEAKAQGWVDGIYQSLAVSAKVARNRYKNRPHELLDGASEDRFANIMRKHADLKDHLQAAKPRHISLSQLEAWNEAALVRNGVKPAYDENEWSPYSNPLMH